MTQPTDWCAPMVPVLKKSTGKARICVDLKRLNEAVKREQYILPTTDEITAKLSGATVFSSLDAASGFFQIPLHPTVSGRNGKMAPRTQKGTQNEGSER